MSILDAIPSPKALTIGERRFIVSQFQLKDWAGLQNFLEGEYPHPYLRDREELKVADERDRKRRLVQLLQEDQGWPPRFPCAESDLLLLTVHGLAFFLRLALSKHNDVSQVDFLVLARTITEPELLAVEECVYNLSPTNALYRMIFPRVHEHSGEPPDFAELIDIVAREHAGWTYEYIASLTLSQFSVAMTGKGEGRPQAQDWSHLRPEEVAENLRKQRAEFGLDQEAHDGD